MALSQKRNHFFISYTNLVFFFFLCISLLDKAVCIRISNQISDTVVDSPDRPLKSAVFALGSFWRSEAAFGCINGVVRTTAGYAGGTKMNPEYRNLGDHAESVQVSLLFQFEDWANVYFVIPLPPALNWAIFLISYLFWVILLNLFVLIDKLV